MRRATQGLVLGFLGVVLLRLALTDAYLRYVTSWMKWPIVASGVLLLLLALGPVLDVRDKETDEPEHDAGDHDGDHDHDHVPRATWLLLLPGLVAFMIAPPALGSYLAERRADEAVVATATALPPLPDGERVQLEVVEFIGRSQDGGATLSGRSVAMTGFVSYDDAGGWYVTRLSISCCAADAVSHRVRVESDVRPPRDQWVTVTGQYVDGTGELGPDGRVVQPATVLASEVVETAQPAETYS